MYTPLFPSIAFSKADARNMQRVWGIKSRGFRDVLFNTKSKTIMFPSELEAKIYMEGAKEAKKLIEKYNLNICQKENT